MFHTLDQVQLPLAISMEAATQPLCYIDTLGCDDPYDCAGPRKIFTTIRMAILAQGGTDVPADTIRIIMNTADSSILHYLYGERFSVCSPSRQRFRVLLSATHLFLYVVLREVPTASHQVRALAGRLRAALGDLGQQSSLWVGHCQALFWILFVGYIGTVHGADNGERQWYTSRLTDGFKAINATHRTTSCTADNLQHILLNFLWKDGFCQPALEAIWNGFQETQEEDCGTIPSSLDAK
jgi:hypothetical protein